MTFNLTELHTFCYFNKGSTTISLITIITGMILFSNVICIYSSLQVLDLRFGLFLLKSPVLIFVLPLYPFSAYLSLPKPSVSPLVIPLFFFFLFLFLYHSYRLISHVRLLLPSLHVCRCLAARCLSMNFYS